eukprot:COSAG02_NODE_52555_length_307_cov_0.721154_2_plen_54_part_01
MCAMTRFYGPIGTGHGARLAGCGFCRPWLTGCDPTTSHEYETTVVGSQGCHKTN